jgi:hypothetical protein
MAVRWPTSREGTELVEMATDRDLGQQIHALMIAIHDIREDVALLQKATGVQPAGGRAVYPEALDEVDSIPAAMEELRGRVDALERGAAS